MWVLDTSAAIRLFVPDGPLAEGAEAALLEAGRGGPCVVAPQLLLIEAASVLLRKARRGELLDEEVQAMLGTLQELPVRWVEHGAHLAAACRLAQQHGLTAYDALYLAIAEHHGARLLTCDEALGVKAAALGLR